MRHPYPALYSKNKSLQHLLLITITIDLSENTSIIFGSIADQLLNSPSNGFSDMGEDTNHALDSPGNVVDAAPAAPADTSGDNNKDEMEKKVQVVMRLMVFMHNGIYIDETEPNNIITDDYSNNSHLENVNDEETSNNNNNSMETFNVNVNKMKCISSNSNPNSTA
eukprot:352881_1